jgi:hypothetical protein
MKKIFAILSIATVLVACNNSATTSATTDSTTVKVDSTVVKTDTTKIANDSSKMKMAADTTKKK